MTEPKKMAILQMDPAGLRDLLQLPPGAEVVRIEMAPGYRSRMQLVIEGAGWDTWPGNPITPAGFGIVTVTRDEAGQITRSTIDWGLPPTVPAEP